LRKNPAGHLARRLDNGAEGVAGTYAMNALLQGRCIGWLFDDNLINVMFADPSGTEHFGHWPALSYNLFLNSDCSS
jgi:hypothetical protein